MRQALFIYNPAAGNGVIQGYLDQIIEKFEADGLLILPYRLGGVMDVDKIFEKLGDRDFYKIICAGGDGTINLVVNAMVRHGIELPLAIFPTGTANDLAGYLEIPQTIDGMIETALTEHYIKADVGTANGKCFINVLAIGMLVDISQRTDPTAKNTLGLGAYYLRGLAEVPFAKAAQLRISCENRTIDTSVSAVLVMNGRAAGGFKNVAPYSEINDGLLDVVVFHKLILPVMLPVLIAVMTGQHANDKRVEYFRASKLHIEATGDEVINTDLDGERGDPLPLDIGVLPSRLLINTPK